VKRPLPRGVTLVESAVALAVAGVLLTATASVLLAG
jgi:prepilin-type N-terminal cleavage/methylation domain-containing protein